MTRKAEMALAGDVTALRLCLKPLVPPSREAPVSLDLPPLETRADTGGMYYPPCSGERAVAI
ncbi:MAG: hypothetical protein ACREXW_18775 [Gammaproteobacteria bacterium]